MSIAYLLSGSNQGDRVGNLEAAITSIGKLAGEIIQCSPVFESPAWGFDHPSPFLNQAIKLKTSLEPEELLKTLLSIEDDCGRTRNNMDEYEARTLDIDILLYENAIIKSPQLIVPHPRMHLRRFTLLPLSSIAANIVHPVIHKSIQELLKECPDDSIVRESKDCTCCSKKEVRDAV